VKIAHIAPHVGGGVGSVLKGFFSSSISIGVVNFLYCLDFCNSNFSNLNSVFYKCEGVYYIDGLLSDLKSNVSRFDVVLVHYWNHPLLSRFLTEVHLPSAKVVLWCHNSGLFEPHLLPKYLVTISRKIIFTSACSYEAPNLKDLIGRAPEKFADVHSTRSLYQFLRIGSQRSDSNRIKNLLYVGTVSDAKMHPHAAGIFAALSQQGFSIQVVGGPNHESLTARVRTLGGIIETTGEVRDVTRFFAAADLFIYPLRSDHYGTGEQVMLEALASGLPIVAFNNPAERAVLLHGGGTLVSTTEEFLQCVCNYRSDRKRYRLESRSAVDIASEFFDLELMTKRLLSEIESESGLNSYIFHGGRRYKKSLDALELYALHSLLDGEQVLEEISLSPDKDAADIVFDRIKPLLMDFGDTSKWLEESKSTPKHYLKYFPSSKPLLRLSAMVDAYLLSSQ